MLCVWLHLVRSSLSYVIRSIYVCCLKSISFWYVCVAIGCFYSHQIDLSMINLYVRSVTGNWKLYGATETVVSLFWSLSIVMCVSCLLNIVCVTWSLNLYAMHNWFGITSSSLTISSEDAKQGFSQNCLKETRSCVMSKWRHSSLNQNVEKKHTLPVIC